MELISYFDLHLVYLVIFSLALAIGAGASLLSSVLFSGSLRDNKISADEFRILVQSRSVVWVGIILYISVLPCSRLCVRMLQQYVSSMGFQQ